MESVFRGLQRVLQLDTLISYSPGGSAMQGAVAVITSGLLLRYHAGGALSLKVLQRRVKQALPEALFAAGVAEGERRARERRARCDADLPLLREAGYPRRRWQGGVKTQGAISFLTHYELG